jgi:hypothetical protein
MTTEEAVQAITVALDRRCCHQCHGAGTVSVMGGQVFETDSDEEAQLAYQTVACPTCIKVRADALAALEEMRKDSEQTAEEPTHIYHACGYIDEGGPGFPCTNSVELGKHCEGHTDPAEQKTANADAAIEQAEDEHIRRFGGEWGDEHTEDRKAWAAQRAGAACQCPARIAIRLFLSGLAPASLGRQMYFLKDRTELESALSARCPCCAERDEAIHTRSLAQAASTRDLEAKRAVEEKLRLALDINDLLRARVPLEPGANTNTAPVNPLLVGTNAPKALKPQGLAGIESGGKS